MSSPTRDTILRTLRLQGTCTVKELAEAADISPISVRHHLSGLQAEGLVAAEEARHGVGRPMHVYSLTDKGLERFPWRYFHLADYILKELKDSLPQEKITEIFTGIAASMSEERMHGFEGLNLQDRIKRISQSLSEEGFEVKIENKGDELLIYDLSCPYFRIGKIHPEVCMIDQTFFANAFEVPIEHVICIHQGDSCCSFSVQLGENEKT